MVWAQVWPSTSTQTSFKLTNFFTTFCRQQYPHYHTTFCLLSSVFFVCSVNLSIRYHHEHLLSTDILISTVALILKTMTTATKNRSNHQKNYGLKHLAGLPLETNCTCLKLATGASSVTKPRKLPGQKVLKNQISRPQTSIYPLHHFHNIKVSFHCMND